MNWDIKGKHCIVTGASSGIGRETALGLARLGARVIMVCRDPARGQKARDYVTGGSGNHDVELMLADLSSQSEVRELVRAYRSRHESLHVLVNNAGIIMGRRELSVDGVEMTFAVNYLAYFMLTNLLVDLLKRSAPARVVNLTSAFHRNVRLDFGNLQGEREFRRDPIYAQSKLADIIFTNELARRLEGTGVSANTVCPGAVSSHIWASSSKTVDYVFNVLMKGPREGAKIPVYLASSGEVSGLSGKYFETRQHVRWTPVRTGGSECRSSTQTYDAETAKKLWQVSESLTGISSLP